MTKNESIIKEMSKAGTGFMINLTDTIRKFEAEGYVDNLVPNFDHFSCRNDSITIYPKEIVVDKMIRFENSSDPDDQSILYAIRSNHQGGVKGLYVDSYGTYHDELSASMIEALAVDAR